MRALTYIPPNRYNINASKIFEDINFIKDADILLAFDFAYIMSFGQGFHRNYRTGGQTVRKNGEKFCNTFQGKLAEIVLYNYLTSNSISCSEVDYRIMGKSAWDDSDFVVNGKHINVKSVAFFSNLLLLEKDDWNSEAHYIPNIAINGTYHYDHFILIRIKPDIKNILRNNSLYYSDNVDKEILLKLILNNKWYYDIPGFISHQELKNDVIMANHILPQNSSLNGKTQMDASNYYIQSGDLHPINEIVNLLDK